MRQVPSWDEYFCRLAQIAATRSKDPDRQVGCLIVRDRRILATGYNGFPAGVKEDFMRWEKKSDYVVHAEQNAIYYAAKHGVPIGGATAFVTRAPCHVCMGALINAGIREVVSPEPEKKSKWAGSWAFARIFASEAGVTWRYVEFAPSA